MSDMFGRLNTSVVSIFAGAVLALLLWLLAIAYLNFERLADANARNSHGYRVIVSTDHVMQSLLNIQTGVRGFDLTGNERFLDPYKLGVAGFRKHVRRASRLSAHNPVLQRALRDLRRRYASWRQDIDLQITLRRRARKDTSAMNELLRLVQSGVTKQKFDAMRALVSDMEATEYELLAARAAAVATLSRNTHRTLTVGGLFAALVAMVLSTLLARSMARVEATNIRLYNSETQVREVLANVAEGIVTTDALGGVKTANPAVAQIFGYELDEIVDRDITLLFFIGRGDASREDYPPRHILVSAQGTSVEIEGRRKGGTVFPLQLTVSEMRLGSQRRFVAVMQDITERKMTERTKLRDEFISTVSHELRTPLTSIRGSLGLIAGGVAGALNEQGKQLVDIACNNSDRLARLINAILDTAKIDSGKMQFRIEPIELMPLIE